MHVFEILYSCIYLPEILGGWYVMGDKVEALEVFEVDKDEMGSTISDIPRMAVPSSSGLPASGISC